MDSKEILELYEKIKLSDEYFNKYNQIDITKIDYQSHHIGIAYIDYPRIPIIMDFVEWIKKYNLQSPKLLLTTCEKDPELKYISCEKMITYDYDADTGKGDLHKLDECEEIPECDLVIINQTLEHVYNPLLCLTNVYKKLKKGGFFFTSVPTYNIPHLTPFHFCHFTPMGLAVFMKQAGFEIIEVGQWGNTDYINKLTNTYSWPGYCDLNKPIINDKNHPCQVWTLVRKN